MNPRDVSIDVTISLVTGECGDHASDGPRGTLDSRTGGSNMEKSREQGEVKATKLLKLRPPDGTLPSQMCTKDGPRVA